MIPRTGIGEAGTPGAARAGAATSGAAESRVRERRAAGRVGTSVPGWTPGLAPSGNRWSSRPRWSVAVPVGPSFLSTASRTGAGVGAAVVGLVFAFLAGCGGRESGSGAGEDGPALDRVLVEGTLGPVSAVVKTRSGAIRFGDRLPLSVEITTTAAKLEPWSVDARLGHLRVRGRKDATTAAASGAAGAAATTTRYAFTVEPELSGTNLGVVPPLRFTVSEGEGAGTTRDLVLPSFEIEVAPLESGERPALSALSSPLPPLALPKPETKPLFLWIGAGAVVALGLGLLVWRRFHRPTVAAAPPPLDPAEEARLALERLLAQGLVAAGRFGDFYLGLTGIVRRYIERTRGIAAPKQTTEEFLREVSTRGLFAPEQQSALQGFLEAADLVKFAGAVPDGREVDAAVEAAREFCGIRMAAAEARR